MNKVLSKIFSILFALIILVGAKSAFAGTSHNIFGEAWSSTIGWISFNSCTNPTDSATCGSIDYGVSVQGAGSSSVYSGYAWNDAVGWISFNPNEWADCPPNSGCTSSNKTSWLASYTNTSYARVLSAIGNQSGDYDGWITFAGSPASGVSCGYGAAPQSSNIASSMGNGFASNLFVYPFGENEQLGTCGEGYWWGGGDLVGWIDLNTASFASSNYRQYGGVFLIKRGLLLTANPITVSYGGSTTLSWSTPQATSFASCTPSGGGSDWSGATIAVPNTNGTVSTKTVSVPSNPTTYTLSCTTSVGTTLTVSVTVTIATSNTSPSLAISASPAVIDQGDATTLSWSSPNNTVFTGACSASGGSTDWDGTSQNPPTTNNKVRTKSVTPPSGSNKVTYTITCSSQGGGTVSDSVDVYINTNPTALSLNALPKLVQPSSQTELTWNSSNGTSFSSCVGIGGQSDWDTATLAVPTIPKKKDVTPFQNAPMTIYTIKCTPSSAGADVYASTDVYLSTQASGTSSIKLSASPTKVSSGGTTTLSWSSPTNTLYSSCYATGGGTDWSASTPAVPTTGNPYQHAYQISVPYATTSYSISCATSLGVVDTATVVVTIGSGSADILLTASASTINSGDTVNLSWSSPSGATLSSCVGSGGGSQWNASQLAPTSVNPTRSLTGVGVPYYPKTTFVIECTDSSGNIVSSSTDVTINHVITATLSTTNPTVTSGATAPITLTTSNVTATTSCVAGTPSNWTSNTSGSGWTASVTVSSDTTYTVTCTDSFTGATASDSLTIKVISIDSFTKSGLNGCVYGTTQPGFYWASTNALSCDLVGPGGTESNVGTSGNNYIISQANGGTGNYKLVCYADPAKTISVQSSQIAVGSCTPTFSFSGKTTCDTGGTGGNTNVLQQVGGATSNYKATLSLLATPLYGFSSNISTTIIDRGAIPSSVTLSPPTLVSAGYSDTFSFVMSPALYSGMSWNNNYTTIKIRATSGIITKTASFAVCGSGASMPRPIYKEI